jgi:uncharacterized protein YfkK (UPF0435 family)
MLLAIDGESEDVLGMVRESRLFGRAFVRVESSRVVTYYAADLVRKARELSPEEIQALARPLGEEGEEGTEEEGPIDMGNPEAVARAAGIPYVPKPVSDEPLEST